MAEITDKDVVQNNAAGVPETDEQGKEQFVDNAYMLTVLHENEKAHKEYEAILEKNPGNGDAWYNKGVTLQSLGRVYESMDAYEQAVRINPGDSDAWYNWGLVLLSLSRPRDAVEKFAKAFAIDPSNTDAGFNKGNAFLELGAYDEAISAFDDVLAGNPNHEKAAFNKALACARIGEEEAEAGNEEKAAQAYEKAVRAYDNVIRINPNDALLWYSKGQLFLKLKDEKDALESFSMSLKLIPDLPSSWFRVGGIFALCGQKEMSLKYLSRALKADSKVRETAPQDLDYRSLWDDPDFKAVLDGEGTAPADDTPQQA
ncbi:MAG: tetratricopeptide repeat protein [Methanosarcinaceae archaeon]|nr:tetratricopeptide repeat protein [Methanosarcinaceae archaeon]